VLLSAEIVGHVAGEKFRFNSSNGKPVADTNFNSATCLKGQRVCGTIRLRIIPWEVGVEAMHSTGEN
jgi:hypothetical protein